VKGLVVMFVMYPALHMQLARPPPPGESENAGHPMQLDELIVLYVFGWHGMHDVAPSWEYVPAGHHEQLSWLLAPVRLEFVPAGQARHDPLELAPTAALNVPGWHDVHDDARAPDHAPAQHRLQPDALPAEYWPATQLQQVEAPCEEKVPLGQAWHEEA